jgi:hypothetical protein
LAGDADLAGGAIAVGDTSVGHFAKADVADHAGTAVDVPLALRRGEGEAHAGQADFAGRAVRVARAPSDDDAVSVLADLPGQWTIGVGLAEERREAASGDATKPSRAIEVRCADDGLAKAEVASLVGCAVGVARAIGRRHADGVAAEKARGAI